MGLHHGVELLDLGKGLEEPDFLPAPLDPGCLGGRNGATEVFRVKTIIIIVRDFYKN